MSDTVKMSVSRQDELRQTCPKCGKPMRDLRDVGFNSEAVRKDGVCFRFGPDVFECVTKPWRGA